LRPSRSAGFFMAFLLSFAIYLIPLFHLEAGWLSIGKTLSGIRDASNTSLAWIFAVLILQVSTFLAALWFLTRVNWIRILVFVAAFPVLVVGANLILLWWIPLLMLVERDTAPELGSPEQVCSIPGATVAQVRSGSDLSLVHAGEAWLDTSGGLARSVLTMPGCQLIAMDERFDSTTIDAVAPGGVVLHRQIEGAIAYLDPASNGFATVSKPDGVAYWNPILSDDGQVLVWLDRTASDDGRRTPRLHLRNLSGEEERIIPIRIPGPDQIELMGARSRNGPFTLARFRNAIFEIDQNGEIVRGPVSPDGIYDARWGFVWLNGGWIAWDGYREDGRSRIVWDIPNGRGVRSVPLGQRIDSVTVAANGDLIAVAVSSNLRIGDIQSSVFAFRTDTGEEAYRRRHRVHMRSAVAFLGDEYLAVTEMKANQGTVGVYRMPATD